MRVKGKTIDFKLQSYKSKEEYNPTWTIADSYIPYKEELGDLALNQSLYTKLLKEIMWELSKDVIRDIKKVKLPNRLGDLGIKKRMNSKEYTRQRMDFNYYKTTGKITYHCNLHTNKYYFFWDWDKSSSNGTSFTNKTYYKFIPARGNDKIIGKRGLSNWIKYCASNPNIRDYDTLIKR